MYIVVLFLSFSFSERRSPLIAGLGMTEKRWDELLRELSKGVTSVGRS